MGKQRKGLRVFFYFRLGYATYLALLVGVINVLTSTYFLAIERAPFIKSIFPTFELYILTAVAIGLPVVIFSGWFHYKKAGTYSAELSIAQQNHVYNYKWLPGYHKEVFSHAYLAIFRATVKQAKSEKLSDEEIQNMNKIEKQLQDLIDGEYAGNPPKGAFR